MFTTFLYFLFWLFVVSGIFLYTVVPPKIKGDRDGRK